MSSLNKAFCKCILLPINSQTVPLNVSSSWHFREVFFAPVSSFYGQAYYFNLNSLVKLLCDSVHGKMRYRIKIRLNVNFGKMCAKFHKCKCKFLFKCFFIDYTISISSKISNTKYLTACNTTST